MQDRTDLIDLTNNLLSQLRLLEMAASAVDDRTDRDALQSGAAAALETLQTIKAILADGRHEAAD